jgi:DNA adenine methylase
MGRIGQPLHWYGSKWRKAPWIISLTPPHTCFVELFAGSCSVLLAKEPSPVEVAVDIDGDVCNFFRVLRDARRRNKLIEMLELTPYSREELESCLEIMASGRGGTIGRAWAFCVCCNSARDGKAERATDWSYSRTASSRGARQGNRLDANKFPVMARNISVWDRLPAVIAAAGRRMRRVQIECDAWERAFPRFDGAGTHTYADPPYFPGTRVKPKAYRHEMSEQDHAGFLRAMLGAKGTVAVSGYSCELYEDMLSGWRRRTLETKALGGRRHRKEGRTECLWMNYDLAEATC